SVMNSTHRPLGCPCFTTGDARSAPVALDSGVLMGGHRRPEKADGQWRMIDGGWTDAKDATSRVRPANSATVLRPCFAARHDRTHFAKYCPECYSPFRKSTICDAAWLRGITQSQPASRAAFSRCAWTGGPKAPR